MTLLEIIRAVAVKTAFGRPDTAIGAVDQGIIRLVQFSIDTANDAVVRYGWGALRETAAITGTGAAADYALPAAYQNLIKGGSVFVAGVPVRGGLSPDEWAALPATSGTPRFFRVVGGKISFWPHLASGVTATVHYQSKHWCSNGSAAWSLDTDTALIPDDLIVKGTIARERRERGQDFADYMAEYEAALANYSDHDQGGRSP